MKIRFVSLYSANQFTPATVFDTLSSLSPLQLSRSISLQYDGGDNDGVVLVTWWWWRRRCGSCEDWGVG